MMTIDTRKHLLIAALLSAAVIGGCCAPIPLFAFLPKDPQAGIAILIFSFFIPTGISAVLAFFTHRARVQMGIAYCAALGYFFFLTRDERLIDRIPVLAMIALFSLLPAIVAAGISGWLSQRMFGRQRSARGPIPCPACGYSLVGLTAQHCPECGERVDFERLGRTPQELARAARRSERHRD